MEVGLARREPLGERQREPGLDQHVQAPALHLGLLVLAPHGCLGRLGHECTVFRAGFDDPYRRKVGERRRIAASARVEALGELLAGEQLDGPLELALEPRRGLFSRLAEALVEGLHRDLRVALDLSLGDPREPLGLSALPLHEHHVEAATHVRLRPLDRLRDRVLALAETLGDLGDRASALERLGFELVERLGDRLAGRTLELLPKAEYGLPLLVRRRAELRRLRLEPALDVRDRLAVALPERGELRLEVALRPVEVVRERRAGAPRGAARCA